VLQFHPCSGAFKKCFGISSSLISPTLLYGLSFDSYVVFELFGVCILSLHYDADISTSSGDSSDDTGTYLFIIHFLPLTHSPLYPVFPCGVSKHLEVISSYSNFREDQLL